jgi:GMP synthase (glutamine-hydrolysing)
MARTVVLLQVRDEPEAQEQERLCFLESCGLEPVELETVNLVEDPALSWESLSEADAVMIGGAGAYSATQRYPFSGPLESVVRRIVDEGKPMFASCFGHHFLAQALGGELVTDHQRGEVGTFDIELTTSGRQDPLLSSYPTNFAVQLGHHDVIVSIPDRVRELAFSEKCRYQMLRVVDKPIYSTQFHPEMSEQHLQARLEMYRDSYLADQTSDEEVSLPLRPSTWADRLLRRFLDLYV